MISLITSLLLQGHLNTEIGGIGVRYSHSTHGVVCVIKGSPAQRDDIREDDILLEADGSKNLSHIYGEPYTLVHLKIKRGNDILDKFIVRLGLKQIYGREVKVDNDSD